MDLKVINRTKNNPWIIGWAIGAIAFALIVVWQNRGLTFFWDEWDVVWATLESPYYGVLQDNGGNFFPLSRIVFGIELAVFGTWYPGYMFVTSLLFGATAFTFNCLLDDGTKSRRIALSAFALIYLSSTGVLFASSMGFMLKWGLSPLLTIIAAFFFLRSNGATQKRNLWLTLGWLFFLLSWAAFSSSIVLMALLVVGLLHIAPQGLERKARKDLRTKLSAALLASSAFLAVLGIRLAELNPPMNPLVGNARGTIEGVLALDPVNAIQLTLAASLAGIVSVVLAVPLQSNEINTWLIIAFRDYLLISLGVLVAFFGIIYGLKKTLPSRELVLMSTLFVLANAFIAVARTPFIHRYQTLWVLIAILVILSLFKWFMFLRLPFLRNIVIGLLVVSGSISAWHIGINSLSIATIERQRDIAESAKLTNPDSCLDEAGASLDQVAPTITELQVCQIMKILAERSWILKSQGTNID